MANIKVKFPNKKMKYLFWSYDMESLDLEKDKDYIITQVLNYGDWEDLKWFFRIYSREEIREVVARPSKGVWFEKVLNFWIKMFNIKIKKEIYKKAILNLGLQKE